MTPFFVGSEPVIARRASTRARDSAGRADRGLAMINALTKPQRKKAILEVLEDREHN